MCADVCAAVAAVDGAGENAELGAAVVPASSITLAAKPVLESMLQWVLEPSPMWVLERMLEWVVARALQSVMEMSPALALEWVPSVSASLIGASDSAGEGESSFVRGVTDVGIGGAAAGTAWGPVVGAGVPTNTDV